MPHPFLGTYPLALMAMLVIAPFITAQAQTTPVLRFKAIAFDAFPVFDPRPIAVLAEELYPGKGADLMQAWRTRQFEYQWLRALSGRYVDFMQTTEDGLVFAARGLHLDLSAGRKERLLAAYQNLAVWPDAIPSVKALREAGFRLVFLSNMTEPMLDDGLKSAGLRSDFEAIYSTDAIATYKPAPLAYQMAMDGLDLARDEILFVAFAGWDAAGAKWFGYPTFWVNRLGSPMEELGIAPDAQGPNLQALVEFVSAGAAQRAE